MPRASVLAEQDITQVQQLLLGGQTVAKVAKYVGISRKLVLSEMKRHTGLTVTELRDRHMPVDVFEKLLMDGRSVKEVATITGCTENQVRSAVKRSAGVTVSAYRYQQRLVARAPTDPLPPFNDI